MDEIIAVGDINFQEKCFAKMRAVSREGRTVFLVSHNLDSIQKLCKRVLLLQSGRLSEEQDAQKVIELYVSEKDKGAEESRLANQG